ncbi:MAG TPA: BON domain-containing protein [Candidatus Angelobacter sp.]|nr:BON domain-containing protein [Candidatus Angelobacter sp.]
MKPILALLSLLAALGYAQQPTNPSQNPPAPPPTAVPESSQPTPTPQPRQDKASANNQIKDNVRSAVDGDPILSGTSVQVSVDDVYITLTGSVDSQGQLQRVLQLVSPYANVRQVVNKIQIR